MRTDTRAGRLAASAGGAGLGALTRLVVAARPAEKPLHPRGELAAAVLRRTGGAGTGVPLLDEPGTTDVLCRRSRAVGLPAPLPDIHGLALRLRLGGEDHGDLLLAGTGTGRISRFLLAPSRRPGGRALTTLLPYRSPTGPRLLGAVATSAHTYVMLQARTTGPWQRFGELELVGEGEQDALVSFDPVRHPLPGLETYEWVERLREPAYAIARRHRRTGAVAGP